MFRYFSVAICAVLVLTQSVECVSASHRRHPSSTGIRSTTSPLIKLVEELARVQLDLLKLVDEEVSVLGPNESNDFESDRYPEPENESEFHGIYQADRHDQNVDADANEAQSAKYPFVGNPLAYHYQLAKYAGSPLKSLFKPYSYLPGPAKSIAKSQALWQHYSGNNPYALGSVFGSPFYRSPLALLRGGYASGLFGY